MTASMPCRAFFAALMLVAGTAPAAAQTPAGSPSPSRPTFPAADWQAEVATLLQSRAAAVQRSDLTAFLATMRGAPAPFVKQRRDWFARLRALPLGSYELKLHSDEFGDLARAKDRRRWGPDTHIVQVKERIAFRSFERAPANEDLFLTVRKDSQGWSIVSDTDTDDLALESMRNLWDFGAVEPVSRNSILVIVHPAQRSVAGAILTAAERARATARARWPHPWHDPIIIMIPSTVAELARILQTQFDLSSFVAFASSSLDRSKDWKLTGDRIFLHWPNFRRYDSGFQQLILAHEFTHLATRGTTGPFEPAFMDEGIAQYYGEDAARAPRPEMRKRVGSGRFDGRVPEDWFFTAGPESDIFYAYELANAFVAYLGSRFGRTAGARVYRALASESPVSSGTWRYHLDRAFRTTLGVSFAALERDWAAETRRELG